MVLVDVREKEEFRAGFIPGAISMPRAYLEQQFEQKLPDKNAPSWPTALRETARRSPPRPSSSSATPGWSQPTRLRSVEDLGYPVELPRTSPTPSAIGTRATFSLPEVGEAGQAKLLGAKVLLLGAGGLGSPAALYLAAAGVGTLGIVDADTVDASNLQRQILHADEPRRIAEGRERGQGDSRLEPRRQGRGVPGAADECERRPHFFSLRHHRRRLRQLPDPFLVNDASVFLKKPVVHGRFFDSTVR